MLVSAPFWVEKLPRGEWRCHWWWHRSPYLTLRCLSPSVRILISVTIVVHELFVTFLWFFPRSNYYFPHSFDAINHSTVNRTVSIAVCWGYEFLSQKRTATLICSKNKPFKPHLKLWRKVLWFFCQERAIRLVLISCDYEWQKCFFSLSGRCMPKLLKIVFTFKFHPLHAKISTPTRMPVPDEKVKELSSNMSVG